MNPANLLSFVRQDDFSCEGGCMTAWKIGFAAILLVEGIVFGHLVYLLKLTGKRFNTIIEYGQALSAGVFFSAGLLHVLPEAIELLQGEDPHGEGEEEEEEHEEGEEEHEDEHEDEHGNGLTWAFLALMGSFYALFFIENILVPKILGTSSEEGKTEGKVIDVEEGEVESKEEVSLGGFKSKEFVTGLVEILGLSAHSLIESMALGLSGEFDTVLNIFIATAAHRWATAAAIAFKLVRKVKYLPFLVLLVLFSAMVPIGIGIGAGLTGLEPGVQGVLFAVSAGTFVYIGVYEGMVEVYGHRKQGLWGLFAATLAGAGIIVVVTIVLQALDIHG